MVEFLVTSVRSFDFLFQDDYLNLHAIQCSISCLQHASLFTNVGTLVVVSEPMHNAEKQYHSEYAHDLGYQYSLTISSFTSILPFNAVVS